jgi:hypothetical protein
MNGNQSRILEAVPAVVLVWSFLAVLPLGKKAPLHRLLLPIGLQFLRDPQQISQLLVLINAVPLQLPRSAKATVLAPPGNARDISVICVVGANHLKSLLGFPCTYKD